MAKVSLIATDLDGTLLRNDGTISPRTCAAIGAAQAAGVTVAFVTGRPPRGVRHLVQAAGVTATAVCANGAMLYDAGSDRVLRHDKLSVELARELVTALRERHPEIVFATEHGHRIGYEPRFPRVPEHESNVPEPQVGHALALCRDAELTKLLVHHPVHGPDDLMELVGAVVSGRADVIHGGMAYFVEIAATGVSKARGLGRLCEELEISAAEVTAFGDMPNDLPMLAFAGCAVAVANAHPEVLKAADEVTASNEDDGVAQWIEAMLGQR